MRVYLCILPPAVPKMKWKVYWNEFFIQKFSNFKRKNLIFFLKNLSKNYFKKILPKNFFNKILSSLREKRFNKLSYQLSYFVAF